MNCVAALNELDKNLLLVRWVKLEAYFLDYGCLYVAIADRYPFFAPSRSAYRFDCCW